MYAKVELLRDGQVLGAVRCEDATDGPERWWVYHAPPAVARQMLDTAQRERLAVRVQGVPPSSASRWCRTRYWAGQFTVSLAEIERLGDDAQP